MLNKKFLFLFIFIFLLVLGFSVYLGIKQNEPAKPLPSSSPLITFKPLSFINVTPAQGQVLIGNTFGSVSVFFDEAVDIKTLNVTISPEISLYTNINPYDPKSIVIIPNTVWQPNVEYLITVKGGLLSIDQNSRLNDDVLLRYQTLPFVQTEVPYRPEGI